MHPLLAIEDFSAGFVSGNTYTQAVNNISFRVNKGEIVALVGESGSGKSVTALSILRLLPEHSVRYPSGSMLFSENGVEQIDLLNIDEARLRAIRGNRIAMIFQEPMTSLNPVFSCGEQLVESLRVHRRLDRRAARDKAIDWFRRVKLPEPEQLFSRYPHELSGGQKQRVMIAMAMCCEPALLICDEPTTALDVSVQQTILDLIRELQQQTGMGVIFITHDLAVVAAIADRTVVLYKGEKVEENNVDKLFRAPQHPYTRGLLACRPALHAKGERLPVVSDFLTGKHAPSTDNPVRRPDETALPTGNKHVLLEARHLSVSFAPRTTMIGKKRLPVNAVDDVSFVVYEGETLGLVGESGCGKTTLGRTLLRLIEPTSGAIFYKGNEITHLRGEGLRQLRRSMQIIFQDPYSSLNPRITIGDAISEPLKVHGIGANASERRQRVIDLMVKVDLPASHYHRYPHEFSGGQRQRIVIARALALNPGFIICDESVSALDVSVQAQVLNLINDLKKEFGFTVIFISHDLSVVRYIADRMIVMNKGRIEETGRAEDIYTNPSSAYTKRLLAAIPKGLPA